SSGFKVELGTVVISQFTTRQTQQHAYSCSFVRRLEAAKRGPGAAKHAKRRLILSLRHEYRSFGVRGHRLNEWRLKGVCDLLQFIRRSSRGLQVIAGKHDLHVRWKDL